MCLVVIRTDTSRVESIIVNYDKLPFIMQNLYILHDIISHSLGTKIHTIWHLKADVLHTTVGAPIFHMMPKFFKNFELP